ncbi:hypothetical protein RRF57_000193 [Xylaria bambusicola]|uniref:Uncharacterized protein n=1 Tax=Xylaria bambusicola TaxID=326684 RepID=A0AAN7UBQ5_9PEZI
MFVFWTKENVCVYSTIYSTDTFFLWEYNHSTNFCLFLAVLDPALDDIASIADLFVDVVLAELCVQFRHLPSMLDALARAHVRLGNGREPLLVRPQKVREIAHGDGDDDPAGADA